MIPLLHSVSINLTLDVFCVLISALLIICLQGERQKGKLRRLFVLMLSCNMTVLTCDFMGWAFDGNAGHFTRILLIIVNAGIFIFAYITEAVFTSYLISYIETKTPVSRLLACLAFGTAALAVLLVIISQFTNLYYILDVNNVYHRSRFFWLAYLLGGVILLMNCVLLVRYRKTLSRRDKAAFHSYIILPAAALIAQLMLDGVMLLYAAATFSFFLIYVNIQVERDRLLKEKELELMDSRINIMLSQIQPHFLFNTLTVIGQLCEVDPQQAKTAISEFALFLRMNMDSLTRKTCIPFENELHHVQNYLSLESKRFGEKLQVEYHIREQDFMLPPLTLQPIVENAVRYGVSKRESGGTVTISTDQTRTLWRITVSDNGVGFDPEKPPNDARPHIGLKNVNDRLSAMCGGMLQVASTPGEGTVAVITIPKREKYDEHHSC